MTCLKVTPHSHSKVQSRVAERLPSNFLKVMKKQTFIVEITTPDFDKPIKDYEVLASLDSGFNFPDWKIEVREGDE